MIHSSRGIQMPARNPRVNVVLERTVYDTVRRLAHHDGISISSKVRNLVRDALEVDEDAALASLAAKRERTFTRRRALTHQQVWGKSRSAR